MTGPPSPKAYDSMPQEPETNRHREHLDVMRGIVASSLVAVQHFPHLREMRMKAFPGHHRRTAWFWTKQMA